MAKNNYEVFNAEINLTLKGINEVLKEIKGLQSELNKTVKAMSQSFVIKADLKTFQELLKATKTQAAATEQVGAANKQAQATAEAESKAKAQQKKATDDYNESLRRSKALLEDNIFAKEKTGVDALNSSMSTLRDTLNQVRSGQGGVLGAAQTLKTGFEEISASTSNLRRGLDIIFADTGGKYSRVGQTALGLRTAIFGVGDAADVTNPRMRTLFNILDRVTNSTISANKATRAYAQQAIETSDKIVSFNNDMVAVLDSFRQMSRGAGLNAANQLARLSNRFGEAAKQVQKINNELLAGNMAKAQSETAAYTKSVRLLEAEFERLNRQGIIPTEASLAKLRAQISSTSDPKQRAALQEQLKQQEALKEVYNETAKAVEFNRKSLQQLGIQTAAAANNSLTAWEKFKGFLTGTVENFKKNREQAKGMSDNLFLTGKGMDHFRERTSLAQQSMEGLTKTASVFKEVMLGTFAGNILFAGISKVGSLLMDTITAPLKMAISYVSSLKDEFISANKTVQDFDVTMKQMLTGFDEETILKAMKGANEFIRKVIAKTPFELATGQAAFQQLITGGLDPREWLMPAADAAAAFNKPMQQLIFAIQRLKAGSKGIGIDMIRDFGIPVQQVGQWVNETTGELASFSDVNTKTKEELEAAGFAWQQWKFNAQGALEQNPAEAIKILNGYLQQNATVAGASAARSRTLTGVLSNLKDTVTTLLTAFGQPIFQTVTDILGDIYAVVNELMTVLEPFAKLIGESIAKSFQEWWTALTGIEPILDGVDDAAKSLNETLRTDRFKEIAKSIMTYLKPALQTILLFVRGDWSKAWGVFLDLAKKAIQGVGKFLQTTGKDAFKWGVSFVTMIAKGLASAARSVLSFAVKSIASVISSFLKPGSPPKEGPLKDIDDWGKGLIKTFGEGFKGADFSFMQEALAPIKDFFLSKGQEGKYSKIRDTVAQIIKGINQTGKIDEALWKKVQGQLGKANKEMAEYLRAELQLKQVTKEYQDAEKAGFISQELQDRLDAAQTLVELRREELEMAEEAKRRQQGGAGGGAGAGAGGEATNYKQEYDDAVKFLEKKKKVGLVTEEEYLTELQGLNKQYAEAALAAGDESFAKKLVGKAEDLQEAIDNARLAQQKKDLEKQLQQELRILDRKKELGLITEAEYQDAKVKLFEGYVDQILALDPEADVSQFTSQIVKMREEIAKATEIPLDKPAEILGSFAEDVTGEFEAMIASIESELGSVATSTWEDLKKTFGETFTPVWEELKNEIATSLSGIFGETEGGGLLEGLKGTITNLWDWFAGKGGPLEGGTDLFVSLGTSFLTWANGEGQVQLHDIGVLVGETLRDGIFAAFGIATETTGGGNTLGTILRIWFEANFVAIPGLIGAFLVGAFEGAFSQGWEAWKSVLSRIFSVETGMAVIGPLLATLTTSIGNYFTTMSDTIAGTLAEWSQKIKDIFYDLYVYLVGESIIPDMVLAITTWLTTNLTAPILEAIPTFIDSFIGFFASIPQRILELDIPGQIMAMFTDLNTRIITSGTEFVNNLSTGITENIPTLDEVVSGLTQGIADYFPFSPAKKGALARPVNWGSWFSTGLSDALLDVTNRVRETVEEVGRLAQPLGSGFGNYGKNSGDGPSIGEQGGIAASWKRFFMMARSGGLGQHQYGRPSSFAEGSWNVPKTGMSLIHQGEIVIPRNHADKIRSGGAVGGNYYNEGAFKGAFPNVKNGSDAVDFLGALDRITKRNSLKGKVV